MRAVLRSARVRQWRTTWPSLLVLWHQDALLNASDRAYLLAKEAGGDPVVMVDPTG